MRIVVTGSTGKLGAVVVRDLLDHGHHVVPVDMHPASDRSLPLTRVRDLVRERDLAGIFRGADAICHLGNFPSFQWVDSPTEGFSNNVASTYNVFDAAERAGVTRVIYASSVQAYGVFGNVMDPHAQVSAPCYLPLDEKHPLLPRSAYPLSKASGEWIAESFFRRRPASQVFSLRLTGIRVPGHAAVRPTQPVPFPLIGSLFTYVHVRDAARAVRLSCEVDHPGYTSLNIVAAKASQPWSVDLLTRTYGHSPEFTAPLSVNDPLISITQAEGLLGFRAELPIPD